MNREVHVPERTPGSTRTREDTRKYTYQRGHQLTVLLLCLCLLLHIPTPSLPPIPYISPPPPLPNYPQQLLPKTSLVQRCVPLHPRHPLWHYPLTTTCNRGAWPVPLLLSWHHWLAFKLDTKAYNGYQGCPYWFCLHTVKSSVNR